MDVSVAAAVRAAPAAHRTIAVLTVLAVRRAEAARRAAPRAAGGAVSRLGASSAALSAHAPESAVTASP